MQPYTKAILYVARELKKTMPTVPVKIIVRMAEHNFKIVMEALDYAGEEAPTQSIVLTDAKGNVKR